MTDRQTIGKYHVIEQIGAGGFAAVYKARDPFIKRLVAIKLCMEPDDTLRRRFFREAEISGNLHHPSIVTVFDCGLEDDAPYLVQEYLTGDDLDKLIRRGEPIPMVERLECLMQVAKGLRYAHSKGVTHRDVKPGNVRFLEGGRAKLMDFGIATLKSVHTRLTRVGTVVGTADYLSPEQLRGEEFDQRIDIFSYGVLAYELIGARRPFVGDSFEVLARNILSADPEPLAEVAPDCPPGLAPLVERCLRKDPEERFAAFDEILPALNQVLVQVRPDRRQSDLKGDRPQAAPAAPAAAPGARRRRWGWAVSAAAALALAVAAGFVLFGRQRPAAAPAQAAADARLVVDAAPWGELVEVSTLDGRRVGLPEPAVTPLVLDLAAGGYRAVVADPATGERHSCEVELAAGASERCLVRFGELSTDDYFRLAGWWR